jgi:hypothetical protein
MLTLHSGGLPRCAVSTHLITSRPREGGEECWDSTSGVAHISFWLVLLYTLGNSLLNAKKNIWRSETTRKRKLHQESFHNLHQGCTNTWRQVTRSTEFCTVAPNIRGYSVWNCVPTNTGQEIFVFSKASRLALGPTQRPLQWIPGFFPGGKTAGAWS